VADLVVLGCGLSYLWICAWFVTEKESHLRLKKGIIGGFFAVYWTMTSLWSLTPYLAENSLGTILNVLFGLVGFIGGPVLIVLGAGLGLESFTAESGKVM